MLSCSRTGAAVGAAPSEASRLHHFCLAAVGIGRVQGLLANDVWVAPSVKALALELGMARYYAEASQSGLDWTCDGVEGLRVCGTEIAGSTRTRRYRRYSHISSHSMYGRLQRRYESFDMGFKSPLGDVSILVAVHRC